MVKQLFIIHLVLDETKQWQEVSLGNNFHILTDPVFIFLFTLTFNDYLNRYQI